MTPVDDTFRLYDPASVGADGYPPEWHVLPDADALRLAEHLDGGQGVKHLVRALAGHRCQRCLHPYMVGQSAPAWSPCDERCVHAGPYRLHGDGDPIDYEHVAERGGAPAGQMVAQGYAIDAAWRVLTVHHLNGVKWDLRWWNLTALCQRCHLTIQGKVVMERVWPWEHSAWFAPHAAGWYAASYLEQDLTREETLGRLDELLALERRA